MDANLINRVAGGSEPCVPKHGRIAETWQRYYEVHGYGLWGFSPSPTARILADAILGDNPGRSERIEVVDWGCGYGRDSLYFLELGFDVIGIDVSKKAIALARAAYKSRQATGIPLPGSASFHVGDIGPVFESRGGQKVRAFFSNRVFHLLGRADFRRATIDSIGCLEPGAYFCVSARSADDFDTGLMEWVPGQEQVLARYKDPARKGHEIAFVTRERLLHAVGHDLANTRFVSATEPDRVGESDTHLLVMFGRRIRRVSPTDGCNALEKPDASLPFDTCRNRY
jgi:SAM-dependent methyltransferase